ncbi:MAG TPA: OmpA family protein [Saprospiraceae bacterium]|nr:OmpA family protein [Lewinellaceae bacterium]HPQ21000.1 OmpA family protein [Saprospiraceae bacterium]HRX29217.1 OmpA family protein [Saprospiraceae bacterium]
MTFIVLIILALIVIITIQIGRISDLATKIRGEEVANEQQNNRSALGLLIFLVVFLVLCIGSAWYYKDVMLGYGPLTSASEHGFLIDSMFNWTLFFTGIVFVITHIALFWFSYKYREVRGRKASFMAHDTTLEMVWTLVPAVVMAFLVVRGLVDWNKIFDAGKNGEGYIEIGATGYQFAWDIRYTGADNKLGAKDFRLIDPATNSLGLDWKDEASLDDIVLGGSDVIMLPVDTLVKMRVSSKDVLHSFYLPHFRVKMDAVPGMPTYFTFKPTKTTEEFRQELRKYPEWNEPYDPSDPESKPRWKEFNYELACAELCGKGHYSMRRIVKVVSKSEYDSWLAGQKSFYLKNIRGTENDPHKDELFPFEIENRKKELTAEFDAKANPETALAAGEDIIILKHVFYNTGSAGLRDLSKHELDNVVSLMNKYPNVKLELRGHTDNVGDDDLNMKLSQERADNVYNYLVGKGISDSRLSAKGYGETMPIGSNDTAEGRQENRRTELRIISK